MNKRAEKFNRTVMTGMIFMGIVVIGCVFFFLYWAGNAYDEKQEKQESQTTADSLLLQVEDSTLLIEE